MTDTLTPDAPEDKKPRTWVKINKKSVKTLIKHPLFIGIVIAALSISGTHYYDLQTLQYAKSLEDTLIVDFLEQHEYTAKLNESYSFTGVFVYNPSSKQVAIKQISMYLPKEWLEGRVGKVEQKPDINIPSLESSGQQEPEFQPYMEIASGKIERMKGFFPLQTPSNEGDYYIKFCAITYDNKQFCTNDYLIIHVTANQTLS